MFIPMKNYFYTIIYFDGNNTIMQEFINEQEAFQRYEEVESTDPVYLELSRTCFFDNEPDIRLIKKYTKGVQSK